MRYLYVGEVDVRVEKVDVDRVTDQIFHLFLSFVEDVSIKQSFVGHPVVNVAPDRFGDVDPPWSNVLFVDDLNDLDGPIWVFGPLSLQALAGEPKLEEDEVNKLIGYCSRPYKEQ